MNKETVMEHKVEPDIFVQDVQYEIASVNIEEILERFPMHWQGKRVLVKPNLLGLFEPEKAVTTHPSLVRAVVQCLQQRGAEVTVGDNPGLRGYGDNERVAKKTGVLEASGDRFKNIGSKSRKIPIDSKYINSVLVSEEVLESDIIVSLPKLKTHMLTQLTCAIKNTYGYLVGGEKTHLHTLAKSSKNFSEAVLDIYQIRPPELTIVDAVVAMDGDGPSRGNPKRMGKLISGRDPVLIDLFATHLIGQKPERIPQLKFAEERGLLKKDFTETTIEGQWEPVKDFKMPSTFKMSIAPAVFNTLCGLLRSQTKLKADEKLCIKCGLCADQCPVDAIEMTPFPVFGKECIKCYCCHEICPESAIYETGLMKHIRALWAKT